MKQLITGVVSSIVGGLLVYLILEDKIDWSFLASPVCYGIGVPFLFMAIILAIPFYDSLPEISQWVVSRWRGAAKAFQNDNPPES